MIDFIADNFYYLFLGWLVMNLMQRKQKERGSVKRTATLFQAVLIFVIYIGAMVIREEGLEPKWMMVPFAVVAAAFYFFRDRILPYRRHCVSCGAKLNMNQILMYDANLCSSCDPYEQQQNASGEESPQENTEKEAEESSVIEAENEEGNETPSE